MVKNKPSCIILAGVNGAGKTTFYEYLLKRYELTFVNADEVAKRLNYPKDSLTASFKAGKLVIEQLNQLLQNDLSFIYETTLSSHQSLRLIRDAKDHGYHVALNYIGLESLNMSKARVAYRVEYGGHDIPEEENRPGQARVA